MIGKVLGFRKEDGRKVYASDYSSLQKVGVRGNKVLGYQIKIEDIKPAVFVEDLEKAIDGLLFHYRSMRPPRKPLLGERDRFWVSGIIRDLESLRKRWGRLK